MTSKPIIILILLALLVVPAIASPYPTGSYTDADSTTLEGVTSTHFNATPGNAIGNIVFTVPLGTNLTFTLGYGTTGETISGSASYYAKSETFIGTDYSVESVSAVSIGSNSTSSTFFDVGGGLVNRYAVTGHAADEDAGTEGLAIWDTSLLDFYSPANIAYEPIANINTKPIYWVDIVSDRPITVDISTGETSYIQGQSAKTTSDVISDWLNLFKSVASFLYDATTMIISWGIFFWNNLGLITALYVALTGYMAVSSNKRNILKAIKTWLGYQIVLFNFIIGIPSIILGLIEKARNILKLI